MKADVPCALRQLEGILQSAQVIMEIRSLGQALEVLAGENRVAAQVIEGLVRMFGGGLQANQGGQGILGVGFSPKNGLIGLDGLGAVSKLFVNLGTKDGFYKASFLQFILDMSDLRKEVLGRIDMKEMNSWIEIDRQAAPQMIRAIDGKKFKGRRIRMNDANSR